MLGTTVGLALGQGAGAIAASARGSSPPPSIALRPRAGRGGDFVALAFSTFAGRDIWAGNGGGIWRSDDGGKNWSAITPVNLVGDDAAVRLSGFGSFGANNLWFSATEAGVASGQGLRGFAIEHSGDGGRTWQWSALPSCASCSMSFSVLNATDGFALGSNGKLYQTKSAGENWSVVGPTTPESANPALDFVNRQVGWLTTGDLLEETIDGGHLWRHAQLPSTGDDQPTYLSAPYFFSASHGIVAAAATASWPLRCPAAKGPSTSPTTPGAPGRPKRRQWHPARVLRAGSRPLRLA